MFGCLVGWSSSRKINPRSLDRWNRIPIVILTARCFGKSRGTQAASLGSLTELSGVRKGQREPLFNCSRKLVTIFIFTQPVILT